MDKTSRIFRYRTDHLGKDGRPCKGSHAIQRDGAAAHPAMPEAKIVLCDLCLQVVEMRILEPKEGTVVTLTS